MIKKLTQREKRTIKLGLVCVAGILVFAAAAEWTEHWMQVRQSLALKQKEFESLRVDQAKWAGLMSIVPAFEMPETEEKQKYLFRDKFEEQLKKAGINSKPLQVIPAQKARGSGYRLLRVKSSGKCNFEQVLRLLASLNENPYLVGIEEFEIKCQPEKRREFELNLTVSTFVK